MATRVFQPRFGWSLVAFVLTACGGGGGTGGTQSSPLATSQVLSGRVIYQSAIPDARVSIRDAAGQTWEAVGDANGDYSITIANSVQITPPLLVRATGQGKRWSNESGSAARAGAFTLTPALVPTQVDKSGGAITPFTMYAVANDVGVTHVTPASTVVVDLLSGNRSDAAFANLGKVGTTVAVALDRSLVQTAVTQVRQGLSQLNLPSALLDNPTSPGLVSVDLTSTYDKLVSGDVLGALSQFVSALQTNQIDYGCNGEAFGTIADDGQRRPSCLAGANQDVSWMVTPFLLLETPRSLDVETRATELSDGNADGGGWKFQPTRVVRDQRAANLQAKIVAAFRNRDVSGQLSGTATEVLAVLTSWDDATWSAFNNQLCKTVSADELSDLAYSYLALKKDMRASVKSENNDAAENLLGAASEVGFKTRSINRVLPTFFQSGSGVDTCPILTKTVAAVRSQVTQYKSSPARASLASLMSAVRAEAQALVTAALHQRVSYVDVDFVTPFLTAAANLDVAYNLSLFQGTGVVEKTLLDALDVAVGCRGGILVDCDSVQSATNTFLARLDVLAAAVPPADAAGSPPETGESAIFNVSGGLSRWLIDEYEQHFDQYFEASQIYQAFEVQGYAVDQWRKSAQRDASVLVPDVSNAIFKASESGVTISGQLVMRREDVLIPAIDIEGLQPPRRLVKMRINPGKLPVVAACFSADAACTGRLRRSRNFTPSPTVLDLPNASPTLFGYDDWNSFILLPLSHIEVLPFSRPSQIETFPVLIDP